MTLWKIVFSMPYRPENRPVNTTLATSAHSSRDKTGAPYLGSADVPGRDGRARPVRAAAWARHRRRGAGDRGRGLRGRLLDALPAPLPGDDRGGGADRLEGRGDRGV